MNLGQVQVRLRIVVAPACPTESPPAHRRTVADAGEHELSAVLRVGGRPLGVPTDAALAADNEGDRSEHEGPSEADPAAPRGNNPDHRHEYYPPSDSLKALTART